MTSRGAGTAQENDGALIDSWFLENLVCPRDHTTLVSSDGGLWCSRGHRYPLVDGVPVMLLDDVAQTARFAEHSLSYALGRLREDPLTRGLFVESLGISREQKVGIVALSMQGFSVDPVVAQLVAATNGLMYTHLVGRLRRYPIPEFPMPSGRGQRLLDVGCGWGRWSVAAAVKGYDVVGIDPSLGAVMAARRVAQQMNLSIRYLVADARYMPFPAQSIDSTYSYSVLQHVSRADATQAVGEMGRVLKHGGTATVQMPTRYGIRCLYHQARRAFREPAGFEVRYWTLGDLRSLFNRSVGPTCFRADGYFGIGLQQSDKDLMTTGLRMVLRTSERLKMASSRIPSLVHLADSVFADSRKETSRYSTGGA